MTDCDFCAAATARWLFPVTGGEKPMPTGVESGSDDGWLACTSCHGLIEREDHDGLLERSRRELVARLPVKPGTPVSRKLRRSAERDITNLHARFWKLKAGDPVAIGGQ